MRIRIKEAREDYEKRTGEKITMEKLSELVLYDHIGSAKSKLDLLFRMQRGEYAHPRLEIINRIAKALGVDYNYLIANDINESKYESSNSESNL